MHSTSALRSRRLLKRHSTQNQEQNNKRSRFNLSGRTSSTPSAAHASTSRPHPRKKSKARDNEIPSQPHVHIEHDVASTTRRLRLKYGKPVDDTPITFETLSESNQNQDWTMQDGFGDLLSAYPPLEPRQRLRRHPPPERLTLYDKWNQLIPILARAMLQRRATKDAQEPFSLMPDTQSGGCLGYACTVRSRSHVVVCVDFNVFNKRTFVSCAHRPLALALVDSGFFPSGPSAPGYGFSLELCSLFTEFSRAPIASVHGMAGALHRHHRHSDQVLRNHLGRPIQEGYRRALQHSLQRYDQCRQVIEDEVTRAIDGKAAQAVIPGLCPTTVYHSPIPNCERSEISPELRSSVPPNARPWVDVAWSLGLDPLKRPETIHPWLIERCPPCFNIEEPGRYSVAQGCDIHLAGDGNFSHRHNASAGDCPPTNHPVQGFVTKGFVNAIDESLTLAGRKPRSYAGAVPLDILQADERAHKAANNAQKTGGVEYDDCGLVALVCRHDIPIFVVNVDTPGERQKYIVALITWLLLFLPPATTVAILYDIACVTSRTISMYDILLPGMDSNLLFATAAMHAYAHQWACQLVYNPKMVVGMGSTDGEGVERLWSRLRELIGILRRVSRMRRVIVLDRQLVWIARNLRDDLGRWATRRQKVARVRMNLAQEDLAACGVPEETLRAQYTLQRESQLSVRAVRAPELKRNLSSVMQLQEMIDSIDDQIERTEAALSKGVSAVKAAALRLAIDNFRQSQQQLSAETESLYDALQIGDAYPHIGRLGFTFARLLVQAHDAKIAARDKLIGRFFEFDHLDRAVGGVDTPLGYKRNEVSRQKMTKRTPILDRAIQRYNELCQQVAETATADKIDFPLPQPLPHRLKDLCNSPELLEDVFLGERSEGGRWLYDVNVRKGIRALLQRDRCMEEETRLAHEQENLAAWLYSKYCRIEAAMADNHNVWLIPLLRAEMSRLQDLAAGCGVGFDLPRWVDSQRPADDPLGNDADGSIPVQTSTSSDAPQLLPHELRSSTTGDAHNHSPGRVSERTTTRGGLLTPQQTPAGRNSRRTARSIPVTYDESSGFAQDPHERGDRPDLDIQTSFPSLGPSETFPSETSSFCGSDLDDIEAIPDGPGFDLDAFDELLSQDQDEI